MAEGKLYHSTVFRGGGFLGPWHVPVMRNKTITLNLHFTGVEPLEAIRNAVTRGKDERM